MSQFVVLLGPPGSGKGTQAVKLAESLGIAHVSTGDLFRAMKNEDTDLARKVQAIMASGALVPDDVTLEIVKERLAKPDCAKGALMDGFPRTIPQAEAFAQMVEKDYKGKVVIAPLLEVSETEVVKRIQGRAAKEGRKDDTEEVARERFRVYLEQTEPLIDFYRKSGVLVAFDGERPVDVITADLLGAIKQAFADDEGKQC